MTPTGDGDLCPQDPEHGRMWFVRGREVQWCPNARHAGNSRYAFDGVTPAPRQTGRPTKR